MGSFSLSKNIKNEKNLQLTKMLLPKLKASQTLIRRFATPKNTGLALRSKVA